MIFGIGWGEIFIIGGLTLIVVGPHDFPRIAYQIGVTVTRFRRILASYKSQFYESFENTDYLKEKRQPYAQDSPNLYHLAQLDVQGSAPNTLGPENNDAYKRTSDIKDISPHDD
jgi:Sec-independent protein translocase protein TatA